MFIYCFDYLGRLCPGGWGSVTVNVPRKPDTLPAQPPSNPIYCSRGKKVPHSLKDSELQI